MNLPNRQALSDDLLQAVYVDERKALAQRLQASPGGYYTVSVDAWTHPTGTPIVAATIGQVCFLVVVWCFFCAPLELLATYDTSGHQHNAEYIRDLTLRSVTVAEEGLGVSFFVCMSESHCGTLSLGLRPLVG